MEAPGFQPAPHYHLPLPTGPTAADFKHARPVNGLGRSRLQVASMTQALSCLELSCDSKRALVRSEHPRPGSYLTLVSAFPEDLGDMSSSRVHNTF